MRWVDRIGILAADDKKNENDSSGLNEGFLSQNEVTRSITGTNVAINRSNTTFSLATMPVRVIKANMASTILTTAISRPKPVARVLNVAKTAQSPSVLQRMFIALPYYEIGVATNIPQPQKLEPVRTQEAILFPNLRTKSAMYSALTPTGLATTVIIVTEEVDGTVRVTGGSVTVSCSGLPLRTDAEIEKLREPWTVALDTRWVRTA